MILNVLHYVLLHPVPHILQICMNSPQFLTCSMHVPATDVTLVE
jgi:hypothetical protein